MKLNWHDAPTRTEWGHDMVVTTVALGKDHSVDLYCERNKKAEAEALLKRPWMRLTDEEIAAFDWNHAVVDAECVRAIEAKLKEKNT